MISNIKALVVLHDLPSAAGWSIRTHVPFEEAPVTIPSNRSPTRDSSSIAAADFLTLRST
jgi:hypothetical protein